MSELIKTFPVDEEQGNRNAVLGGLILVNYDRARIMAMPRVITATMV
jgi:hypothetical protein